MTTDPDYVQLSQKPLNIMAAWSKIASMGHVPGNTYDMMKMKRKYITPGALE